MKNTIPGIRWCKQRHAFTLIECILTAAVIMIVIISVITFRYYTITDVEHAENQLLAARSACLLSEAWKGQKADAAFDPVSHNFEDGFIVENIASSTLLTQAPIGSQADTLHGLSQLNTLGIYRLQVDQKEFVAELLYGAVPWTQNLQGIHVLIVWNDQRGKRCEYYLPTLSQS